MLTVHREAYSALLKERTQTNPRYHGVAVDNAAIRAFPEHCVPAQIMECACPLPESDRYNATREGPGTIWDPLDAVRDQDDASEESSGSVEKPACGDEGAPPNHHLNQCETPLGLDPTSTPSYMQHLAAFQAQLRLTKD